MDMAMAMAMDMDIAMAMARDMARLLTSKRRKQMLIQYDVKKEGCFHCPFSHHQWEAKHGWCAVSKDEITWEAHEPPSIAPTECPLLKHYNSVVVYSRENINET